MKRVYRITLIMEREFGAKATRAAKETRDRMVKIAESQILWSVKRVSITNKAKPERSPPQLREPEPERLYDEIAKNQMVLGMREIAADLAALLGNVKKPRIEWAPNRWCDGSFGNAIAHSHNQNGVRWIRGPRAGRKVPKGLICLNKRRLIHRSGYYSYPETWPALMAHEILHLRLPGGSHRRGAFKQAEKELLARYHESKGTTPKEPNLVIEPRTLYRCPFCGAQSLPPVSIANRCPVCRRAPDLPKALALREGPP